MGLFFKKKLDWSKFTKVEEPVEEEKVTKPTPRSYPYIKKVTRYSGELTDKNFTLIQTMYEEGGNWAVSVDQMQVALLMDLRDRFDELIDRLDTLVDALNAEKESDKIEE